MMSVCGWNVVCKWLRKALAFSKSLISHVPSGFLRGGTGGWERRIFLVFCQRELSVAERDARWFVKLSDLILAKILLSLFVRWLNSRLSEGYLVLCQIARAFLFSDIRVLTKCGRLEVGLLSGLGVVEEDHAACWIDVVRVWTASSMSWGDFSFVLRSIRLTSWVLKASQSIRPWVRLGLFGFLEAAVSIVRRTAEWSEHRSLRLVNVLWRLFGIFVTNISRMSGLFLRDAGQ